MQKDKIILTQKNAENSNAGGVVVGKRDGQTMIFDDASVGGYFVGKTHDEGGIKMINKSNGQTLEVQGSEVIITAPAVADQTKREFEGKMMTNREILSSINEMGGGVSFAKGGDIPENIKRTGASYKYGGKLMKDIEIIKFIEGGKTKNYVSYKDKFNKKYGLKENESHTLEEISKETGVSIKGLQQIYNKGIGAYKTNPSSVRPNVKSKEQWAMARVYSAVMGGKASVVDKNELKMNLGGEFYDTKPFLKFYFEDIKDFLKTQNDINLIENYTFIYKREIFTIQPYITLDKTKLNSIQKAIFIFNNKKNKNIGEIEFNPNYKKNFNANSEFFNWNNIKFKDGGKVDLVEDTKNGNSPSRDLNNFNDVLDLNADNMVGSETGLFKKGGATNMVIENWVDIPSQFLDLTITRKVNYKPIPEDNGLNIIVKPFLGKDKKNKALEGINFDSNGISVTNSYILLAIPQNPKGLNNIYKKTDLGLEILDEKFPKIDNIFNINYKVTYKINIDKLLNYCKTAFNFSRKTIGFKISGEVIMFDSKLFIELLTSLKKLTGVYNFFVHFLISRQPLIFSLYDKYSYGHDIIGAILPIFNYPIFLGTENLNNKSQLKVYFDFEDNEIHNADGSVVDFTQSLSKKKPLLISSKTTTSNPIQNQYPEYYEFIEEGGISFTKGKIYKIINRSNLNDSANFIDNEGFKNGFGSRNFLFFKPSTEQSFLTQQGSGASLLTKPFDFSMTKIDVSNNPELSVKVQKKAFEDGWKWENRNGKTVNYNDFNYLYFTKTTISFGNTDSSFNNSPKREITEVDIFGSIVSSSNISATQSITNVSTNKLLTFEDIQNKKIWIGDDIELRDKVIAKLEEIGFFDSVKKFPLNSNCFIIRSTSFYVNGFTRDEFENHEFLEIFPYEIGVLDNTNITNISQTPNNLKLQDTKSNTEIAKNVSANLSKLIFNLPNNVDFAPQLSKEKKDLDALIQLLPSFQQSKYAIERAKILKEIKKIIYKLTYEGFIKPNEDVSSDSDLFTPQGLLDYYFDQTTQNPTAELEPACELITPNGEKSKLPITAYFNVRTEQFKNWFGDWENAYKTNNYVNCSKMIDANTKEPKIYYHGVRKFTPNFGAFSNIGQGVVRPYGAFEPPSFPASYFSEDEDYAKFYGGVADNLPSPSSDYKPFIYKVFLCAKNPMSLLPLDFMLSYRDFIDYIYVAYGVEIIPNNELLNILDNDINKKNPMWIYVRRDIGFIEKIKDFGYDALFQIGDIPIFLSNGEVEPDRTKHLQEIEYLTFYPNQIKSATVKKSFYFNFFNDIRFKTGGYVRI